MTQIGHFKPSFFATLPLSSFELERRAAIERNLFVQDCVRASANWLRSLVLRSVRFARQVAAEQSRRNAVRQLQRLDDRMLKNMGSTAARSGAKC